MLCLLPFCLQAQKVENLEVGVLDPQLEYLRQYEGRWTGEFSIQSTASDHIETFQVEQRYWMKDGELRGVSVSQRGSGVESARSRSYVKDGQIYSVVSRPGCEDETFVGKLHEGGLVWLPADLKRANDYQILEYFVRRETGRVLKTGGFDSYVYGGGLARVIFRGELTYQGLD